MIPYMMGIRSREAWSAVPPQHKKLTLIRGFREYLYGKMTQTVRSQ